MSLGLFCERAMGKGFFRRIGSFCGLGVVYVSASRGALPLGGRFLRYRTAACERLFVLACVQTVRFDTRRACRPSLSFSLVKGGPIEDTQQ